MIARSIFKHKTATEFEMVNIKTMEKISVIIPVYNIEPYLRGCLDSVVNQTYANKEIILIDDGSTDASGIICDDYASHYPYIRVIHKENGGPSSARNCGLDEACGDWIIFLDSDDVWNDKDCMTKLHDYAVSLNLDIVRFEYQTVNENLEPIESRSYNKSNIEDRVIDNYSIVKYGIAGEWFTVLFLIKRDLLVGLRFNVHTIFQEDTEFYCQLFAEKEMRCGYLNEKMYLYRKRNASITTTCRIGNLKGSFGLCDVFYDSSLRTNDKRLGDLYKHYSVMMYYWTLQTLAAEPYFFNRVSIIKELHLDELHNRINERVHEAKVDWKYNLFIKPVPNIGVRILHLKDKIRDLMR